MRKYQICNRCVMDTSDPNIVFFKDGTCNHCTGALRIMDHEWEKDGEPMLVEKFEKIKVTNKDKAYDCIVGISGGIDSSYVAYLGHKYGLRMLGIHVDAGWNTTASENNIQKLCKAYGVDLKIIKINEPEMLDLQRAYFLADVPNQDVPQDHVFFCALYRAAIEQDIRDVLVGMNFSSESILARYFSYDAKDAINLRDIHEKFGRISLNEYPIMDQETFYHDIPNKKLLHILAPLNFIDYDKEKAIEFLHSDCGFEYYGGKHQESRFTKLHQNYILPVKFHHDKRRAHLSSLIVAGQMSREDALKELKTPLYTQEELEADIVFFTKKIGLTREEWERIMSRPGKSHFDYKVYRPYSLISMSYRKGWGKFFIQYNEVFAKHPKLRQMVRAIFGLSMRR